MKWYASVNGGSEWESNPPATGNLPPAGFEDRESHRTPCASALRAVLRPGGSILAISPVGCLAQPGTELNCTARYFG
jgi:hypothetical protein